MKMIFNSEVISGMISMTLIRLKRAGEEIMTGRAFSGNDIPPWKYYFGIF